MASTTAERTRDSARKRKKRQLEKEVFVPRCANKRRRKRLEADDVAWLRWYFDDPADPHYKRFWYPFTQQQLDMIDAIGSAIRHGDDQAIAASRGEGKTKIAERLLLKYVLQGAASFALLCAATGGKAEDSLESIKGVAETNSRLCADYPEVCVPVRALEYTPNRAHYQLVTGRRHDNGKQYRLHPSRFSWCGQEIVMPNVPGSPSATAIIATRGLDAEVRGVTKKDRRVDVVLIDDPDTEETVRTEEQAKKLESRIDRALAAVGGQQRRAARIMLTTLQRRQCVSAQFTDPKQKPSWKGRRFRFLIAKPERLDLWEEYVALVQECWQGEDSTARKAMAFYLERREQMDCGAVVANPNRYDPSPVLDGTPKEVSALQFYHNEIARIGREAVETEYDNDPPEESGPQDVGLTAHRIQRQTSGLDRKVIPPGCSLLTQGIDCGKKILRWVVRAWRLDSSDHLATGYTIDYGVQEVWGTTVGSDEGLDEALDQAIQQRAAAMEAAAYATANGERFDVALTLVDAGWRTEAVYAACRKLGFGWRPAMGVGRSNGCVRTNWYAATKHTPDKKIGDHWFLSRRPKGIWLVEMDADFWKSWEHDRWMTDPQKAGSLLLWGQSTGYDGRLSADQREHLGYAKSIVAECEVEEVVKGVLKRYWKTRSDNNHFLDASYMADVAASMKGVRLVKTPRPQTMSADQWFGK